VHVPVPLELTVSLSPRHHGTARVQTTRSPARSPAGFGQLWENDSPLQTEAQRVRHHRSHHRLQRGNARGEEEREEHGSNRVGCRRPEEDARALAEFPPGRGGGRVRRGQLGPGASGGGAEGAGVHAEERAAAGPAAGAARQQAGRERRSDCHGNQGHV